MPALILDCDGVLAETERDGHLPAFNAAVAEAGVPLTWSDAEYAEKLRIGGGKERMASSLTAEFCEAAGLAADADARDALVKALHRRKTELFLELVATGAMPTRPGIRRLVTEALDRGWTVAVASTSAEPSVRAILERAVGAAAAARCHVFAGDIVAAKKPAPDIYLKVLADLGLDPADCLVVEDSGIGVRAATAAGLTTLVTVSHYTSDDDFAGAAVVRADLGDPPQPDPVTLDDIQHLIHHREE